MDTVLDTMVGCKVPFLDVRIIFITDLFFFLTPWVCPGADRIFVHTLAAWSEVLSVVLSFVHVTPGKGEWSLSLNKVWWGAVHVLI